MRWWGVSEDWARPVDFWELVARVPERQAAFDLELFNGDSGTGPIMTIGAGLGGPESGSAGHIRAGEAGVFNLHRYPEEQRKALLDIRWWDWPEQEIRDEVPLLAGDDVEALIEHARTRSRGSTVPAD